MEKFEITVVRGMAGGPNRNADVDLKFKGKADTCEELREHIVRCVNSHDALVAALEDLISQFDLYSQQMSNSEIMQSRNAAVVHARAALALAKGE